MVDAAAMHRASILALLLCLTSLPVSAVSIVSAYSRYYADADIRPISQYFGAKLTGQGFRSVVASQPEAPAGQYFIARLEAAGTGKVRTARMTCLLNDSMRMATHEWDLQDVGLRKWLYLGLTGTDWPGTEVQPLAWKIELLDASGSVLTEWKSFLWEMP